MKNKLADYFRDGSYKGNIVIHDTTRYLSSDDIPSYLLDHTVREIIRATAWERYPELSIECEGHTTGWNRTQTKVIFNPPATILYKNGKKYVSKCDSADTFDEEKGLMMCLLKSHGYTYSDIERLLKSAKKFGDKDDEQRKR